jgi:hypothetical protein
MIPELFTIIIDLFRSQHTQRIAILAALLTPFPFFLFGITRDLSPSEHWDYISSRGEETLVRRRVGEQLTRNNERIEQYEYLSFDKLQNLTNLLIRHEEALKPEGAATALRIASGNQDLIRALLQFGKIYRDLVQSNSNTVFSHDILRELFESIIKIVRAQELDTIKGCEEMERAYRDLVSLNNRVDVLADSQEATVQMEIYRYISFAAAFLQRKECNEIANRTEIYKNAQRIYTDRANALLSDLKKKRKIKPSEYLRSYWWVDYSLFIRAVSNGKKQERMAELIFENSLMKLLPPEFLRDKLLQHRGLIKEERKDFWDRFIRRL